MSGASQSTGRNKAGQFVPGHSAPGPGKPPTKDIAAIARRFTPDALTGLVRTVRLDPHQHGSNVVQAARELLRWGYGEPPKTMQLNVNADGLAAHLLAVQGIAQDVAAAAIGPQIEGEAEAEEFDPAGLPDATPLPVEEALLPLWEATPRAPPAIGNSAAPSPPPIASGPDPGGGSGEHPPRGKPPLTG